MGAENGPSIESIKGFNGQLLSRSFDLSEKFNKAGVVGDNKDENERDKANERVREILNSSFVVGKVAETQIEPVITFESVNHMIEIANDDKKTEAVRQRAKDALFETGLALSLDKKVFRAATEGGLEEIIPSNLHGIEPYILSSYLTLGKSDGAGQQLVEKLTGVFRLKKRADKDPGYFGKDFEEKAKQLVGELLDRCDEASAEDQNNGNVGRWETMIGYVKGVDDRTGRSPVVTDKGKDATFVESEEDWEQDLGLAQAVDRIDQSKREAALDAGERNDYRTPVWLLSYQDMVDEEMKQRGKQQIRLDPPYPEWYKKLPRRERDLRHVRAKLLNGVAWKQMIRNKDVDKLMSNEAIDLNKHELKLLMEMPHVEEALRLMFGELFEVNPGESKNLLTIKKDRRPDGTISRELDPEVQNILEHFQDYKEKLALRIQFPRGKDESNSDYEQRITEMYNDHDFFDGKEVKKTYKNKKTGGVLERTVWEGGNKTKEGMEFRAAVAVAWEFMYIGNLLESADEDRLLKPSEPVSDKLRTMIHPLAKAMGKWGIYKGDKEGHKGVYGKDEKEGKYDVVTGEEEPMGGPIAAWVLYHLEMDEVKSRKYEDSFRYKLLKRESGYRPLPKRMAASLVEMLEVPVEDKDGKIEMVFLSEALMDREKKINFDIVKLKEKEKDKNGKLGDNIIMTRSRAEEEGRGVLGHEYDGQEHDICVPFRDCMDGCKVAFDALTGKLKYDPKDPTTWSLAFMKDIDLIRQNKVKYDKDDKKSYLRFVDNPEFIAWVVASSVGFDHRSEAIRLSPEKTGNSSAGYSYNVRKIVDLPGLTRLGMDKELILEYLSVIGGRFVGTYQTESYIDKLDRIAHKNDRLRSRRGFNFDDRRIDDAFRVRKKEDEDF